MKLFNERLMYSLKLFIICLMKFCFVDLLFKIVNFCELIINLKCVIVYKIGVIFDILNILFFLMEFMI